MDRRLASTWWILKIALGAAPLLAGLDKFFNLLTNWTDYLNPVALQYVPVSAETFMQGVGVVEMIVGLLILTRWTRLGAYLAACWLVAIAVNLIAMEKFYDIAVRDLLLAVTAFALARLTVVRRAEAMDSDAARWEPSPRGILTLNL
jgi:uncharacterized membrane protein YphA (DoxX/SURF4 family)